VVSFPGRSPPLPASRSPERPDEPARPDPITGPGAENLIGSCSIGPIYLAGGVAFTGTLSPVEHYDPLESVRYRSFHPRRFGHASECRGCGNPGMGRYVERHRSRYADSLLGRRRLASL